jgi:hypothetical protein
MNLAKCRSGLDDENGVQMTPIKSGDVPTQKYYRNQGDCLFAE